MRYLAGVISSTTGLLGFFIQLPRAGKKCNACILCRVHGGRAWLAESASVGKLCVSSYSSRHYRCCVLPLQPRSLSRVVSVLCHSPPPKSSCSGGNSSLTTQGWSTGTSLTAQH